ncbi:MAG TPA: ABC transporter substrate-binding protein [Paludibacteraceae bacterium]|nr:ABC transporter substrate-binding protein [Paludibacteraceae bacterium]
MILEVTLQNEPFLWFNMKRFFYFFTLAMLCCGCGTPPATNSGDTTALPDSTMTVTHAKGFRVDYFDGYKRVILNNPWHEGEILATYYLVKDSTTQTPDAALTIQIPLRSIAVTSCTHFEFLRLIDALNTITGVCNPELIYNDTLRQACENGQIVSLGNAFNTNTERLLHLNPDALMLAHYNQQDENGKRLQSAGIPLIYNNEWTEPSLLARAEWIKLVATFYDKEQVACNLFSNTEQRYNEIKSIAKKAQYHPTVLAGGNFKGTWYVPGGQSYMGQLFADAGADYFYKNDSTTGSLPLNFETVLHHFVKADVWLNAPVASLQELYNMDKRHHLFKSAQQQRVYGFFARTKAGGANDFWESAVAHPDIVLKDVVWALHPELLSDDYQPKYLIKLK